MMILIQQHICRLIMVLLLSTPFACQSQSTKAGAGGITFIENRWDEALRQASKQNKYIFVDAYAVWCGPCKMLKRLTFKDDEAAAFYNKNFINLAMDMEKGQGPALASAWGIRAYPTLMIFNSEGKLVSQTVGFIRAGDLLRFGKQALAQKKS